MSRLNPVGAHIESCATCSLSQKHLAPILSKMQAEFEGTRAAPVVPCDDCREDVTGKQFMLHDHIWSQASRGQDPLILCILCAEKRLQRRLEVSDFQPSVFINKPWLYAISRFR